MKMRMPPTLLVLLIVILVGFLNPFTIGFVLPVFLLVYIPQGLMRNLTMSDVKGAGASRLEKSRKRAKRSLVVLGAVLLIDVILYFFFTSSQPVVMFQAGLGVGSLFSMALLAGFMDIYSQENRKKREESIRKRIYSKKKK